MHDFQIEREAWQELMAIWGTYKDIRVKSGLWKLLTFPISVKVSKVQRREEKDNLYFYIT